MPSIDDGFGNAATTNNRQAARNAGAGNGNQNNNRVPVRDISTQADPAQLARQAQLSRAQAAVANQNFTPRFGQSGGNLMKMFAGGAAPIAQSFMDQTRYGMNTGSQANFDRMAQEAKHRGGTTQSGLQWDQLSPAEQVNAARQQYRADPANNAELANGPSGGAFNVRGNENNNAGMSMASQGPSGGNTGAAIPTGGYNTGTFKPITFRSGTGTSVLDESGLSTSLSDDYAGLSGLVGDGTGLLGQAGTQAQQDPDQFNADFDPSGAAQSLFNERSALLEPAFAQQRAQNMQQMQGMGRLGLQLSGEGVGAGAGMVNPDMFGMNQAQSQALAQLSAQSTQDAFGQEMQRAGLGMSQFGLNQGAKQQQFANLMGSGQGMLSAGMGGAALEQQLAGIPMGLAGLNQQQQGLDQNYELGRFQNDTSRMLSQAQANQANYQPNPWISGLTSLGTSFLGTEGGGDWLSGLFKGRT